MYDKTVRQRRAVLGLLVVSPLTLLPAYFREPPGGALQNVQRGILEVVSPIQEGASRALKPVRDLFGWMGDTVSAKGDLKKARKDRDFWQAKANALQVAAQQNAYYRGLLKLDKTSIGASGSPMLDYAPVTARVIGQDQSLWYRQIYIS